MSILLGIQLFFVCASGMYKNIIKGKNIKKSGVF